MGARSERVMPSRMPSRVPSRAPFGVAGLCLALLVPSVAAGWELPPVGHPAREGRLEAAPLDHIEVVTAGANPTDQLPMIILVHGLGDRPESFVRVMDDFPIPARVIAVRGPDPRGRGHSWFPISIPVRPDDPVMVQGIRDAAAQLAAFSRWIFRRRPTLGKPVIAGFSQGGMLSFAVAIHHPDTVSAAVPVAGALPRALWVAEGVAWTTDKPLPPIRAVHGEADRVVSFAGGEALVEALRAQGRDATMAGFAGVGHRVPPTMRAGVYAALQAALKAR